MPQLTPAQITALDQYVAAPDSSYQFSLNSTITGTGYTDYVINMVSQTWTPSPGDSEVWQHWVQIIVPSNVNTHTAILNISGGSNSATAPTSPDQTTLAAATTLNAIAVFLPTVPNEPVTFPAQGETTPLTEDQIVAYTFEQFLNGNGQDWPLLLPMVKSAVRAMDTTQTFVSSQSDGTLSVDNFIVTGASKRGWTTWLTPAVDTRVIAIVPFVFDGLNLPDQIESQLDTYVGVTQDVVNGDSTAVQDYTNDGVFDFIGTPQMAALDSIVDPFSYIDRSTYNIPKYLVDSTGDQFFVPDAQFFFSDLPGQNYLRYVPNTDHGLNTDAVTGAINFEEALLDGAALPQFSWTVSNSGTEIELNSATTPSSVTMWQATNTTNRDFRLETFGANWTSSTLTDQGGGTYIAQVTPPTTGATDFFIQMQYTVDGVTLTFTTQISTTPLLTPTVVASDPTGNFNGSPFAATATATGPAGLPVPGSFSFTYYPGNNTGGTALPSAPTSPGIYTAVASFTSSDPDYANGASQFVHFQIFKAAPVVTVIDSGGTFNGNPFPGTATIAGVVPGVDNTPGSSLEGVPVTISYYPGINSSGPPLPGPPTAVGQYEAEAGFAGSQDYLSLGRVYVFSILPAVPTITVTAPSGPFNGSSFVATATIAGVVAGVDNTPGSTLEGVGLTFSYFSGGLFNGTPIPGPPTAPGTYAVTASFAGSEDYEKHGSAVAFVISPAVPVISLTDTGGVYNANPFPATATIAGVVSGVDDTPGSSLEGVPLNLSYFAGTTTTGTPLSGAPTNPGQYTALASFAGSTDYGPLSQSAPFQIGQATPIVVASDAGGIFTGDPFPATATATGVGGAIVSGTFAFTYYVGGTVNGNGASTAPSAPGTYTVVAGFTSGDANYVTGPTQSQPVTFSIASPQLVPSVVATDAGGVFNGNPSTATATATGVGGVTVPGSFAFTYYAGGTVSGSPLGSAPVHPGTYTVVASFTSDDADYADGQSQPVVFSITQALPQIVIANPSGVYNGNPFVATATVAGVVTGVDDTPGNTLEGVGLTFSYYVGTTTASTPLSGPPTNAGQYTVLASFGGSQDYLTFGKQFSFVIDLATPTISVSNPSGVFNGNPFSSTATIAGVVSGVDDTPGSSLEGVSLGVSYYVGTTTTGTPLPGPPTSAGQYTVFADFAGSQDYRALGTGVAFVIDLATPTVTATDAGGNFTGNPFPATAIGTGVGGATVGGTFAFTYYVGSTVNGNGTPTAPSAPGTYTVVAAFTSSNSNYVTGPTDSLPVVFTINALSSLPSISAPASASVIENASLVFSSAAGNPISVTDANAGSSIEQLTLTVTKGSLSLATTIGITVTSGANASASMTVQGTLAHLNAALNGLQFTPTNGFTGSASLAVSYKDLANNQTANGSVSITVVAPPVTAFVNAFLPIVVPGEPVPLIIGAIDTSLQAQFSLFKINISFGDGNTASLTSYVPLLVNHIYKKVGVYTVSLTATDEFGRTSAPATVVIHVVSLFFGLNPFNPNQTALFIGEMPGDTVSVTAAPGGGISVTLNGVSQGVFNVTGPVILLGQQPTKSPVGLSVNQNPLVQTPTAASLENQLDSEALQWAGLSAATEILNE